MKIGIDARPLSKKITGIGIYVYEIIKNLNAMGEENCLQYVLYSNSDINIDFKLNKNWEIRILNFPVGTVWLNTIMPFYLLKDKLDVFWGTSQILPIVKCNIKMVLTVHDLALLKYDVGTRYNQIIQRVLLKNSCISADRIITVSKSTKNDLIGTFGMKSKKIDVIYPGASDVLAPISLDLAKKILKDKYKIQDKYILYLGTIEPRKNINTIIKAFKIAKRNKSFDCKLVLVGGLGWKYADMFRIIKRLKLKDDIIMTGYIDTSDKIYFYNACEFFVFPSIYEGFGIPLLEAMKCGKPVITADVSSMPEVVGDAGLMIDRSQDYKELAVKFLYLYFNDTLKSNLSAKALAQSDKFSYAKCAEKVLRILVRKT